MMTNQNIRQEARQLLTRVTTKRYIFAVPLIIIPFANGLPRLESDNLGLALVSLALQILLGFFLTSAALTMLDIWRGDKAQATFTDSTRTFSRSIVGKLILVELVSALYFLLPYLVVIAISVGLAFLMVNASNGNQLMILVSVTLSGLLGLAVLLPIYYSLRQSSYILYDQVKNGTYRNPHQVLMTSYRLMKGHRKQAFLLDLSFIGWAILSVLTLGLSAIYSLPYYTSATAIFYDNLVKQERDKLTE